MKSFAPKPWFAPQPVLIIGTYNKDEVANAMNAAWAGQWDMKEIMISMGNHVTTDNLKLGGEFTVAFATKKTMVASDFVGIVSAKNAPKKMEKTGWNIEKATMVNAPVFTDFPMTLECRIKEKYDESETGYYLVAEIVNILVDEKYLAEDGIRDTIAGLVGSEMCIRDSASLCEQVHLQVDSPIGWVVSGGSRKLSGELWI